MVSRVRDALLLFSSRLCRQARGTTHGMSIRVSSVFASSSSELSTAVVEIDVSRVVLLACGQTREQYKLRFASAGAAAGAQCSIATLVETTPALAGLLVAAVQATGGVRLV